MKGPKPLIEEHHHIQGLIDRQEKRAEDRETHRNRSKQREERENIIKDAPDAVLQDFWCTRCGKDFKAPAIKQVEIDWTNPRQHIAFYKTKHCRTWTMRLITDKNRDPYWCRSKMIKAEQGKYYKDLIQPFETGFNLLYGKKK